ncbi:MAG: hypothetical protein HKN45_07750, partial [Flavobacteriales bacterium]|nr:hypothetical protein [Flavobacteriales bacterium]
DSPCYRMLCPDKNVQPFGVFFGGGVSLTSATVETPSFNTSVSNTTSYRVSMNSTGEPGFGADFGALFILKKSFIRIIDFGLNYREMNGQETMRAIRTPGGDITYPEVLQYDGSFRYQRIAFKLNAQSVLPIGYGVFFHLGPGLMVDETLGQKIEYEVDHLALETTAPKKPSRTDMIFSAGFGFKAGAAKFLNIYAQAPILAITGDDLFSTREEIFNSSYRNTYIGLRFLWMKGRADRVCPAISSGNSGSRLSKKRLQSDFYPW